MVDVLIPTYKPDDKLFKLLNMLQNQTVPVNRIIIINTEESSFFSQIGESDFKKNYPQVELSHQDKKDFDHGRTRNVGAEKSTAELFVCMTQDAVPKDIYLLEELLLALQSEDVAVSYARQLADEKATEAERFARVFNYPEHSVIKSKENLPQLGVKTFFCSNVCAAYNKKIFNKLGGFISHTIFNEDMIFAGNAIQAGYKIAYAAKAQVIHSHHYSHKEQFRRNFDLGVSQSDHPEIFGDVSSQSEGIKMVKQLIKHLIKEKKGGEILPALVDSGYKYLGYQMGKRYKNLPHKLVLKWSMNPKYWAN